MFVKLNFSTNKDVHQVHQILNAIINNVNINNMASLSTAAASWNANIVSGLDYTTSEIIRTVEPTTVKSHLADNASNGRSLWTMEFQVYDASDRKYYIQFDGSGENTQTLIRVGNTIMSGSKRFSGSTKTSVIRKAFTVRRRGSFKFQSMFDCRHANYVTN